jgi:hypothetical protein
METFHGKCSIKCKNSIDLKKLNVLGVVCLQEDYADSG